MGIKIEKISMTAETLRDILSAEGIEVRYNLITHTIEIIDTYGVLNDAEKPFDTLIAYIIDKYREEYKYCTKDGLVMLLGLLANNNQHNPILERIIKYSKEINVYDDYIGEISHNIMNIADSDKLSHLLFRKTMEQKMALSQNDADSPFGAEAVTVLNGDQGIGKSLLTQASAVESKYYRTISLNSYKLDETDVLEKAGGVFMGEIPELEKSLKPATLDFLKAFITAGKDSFRPKYGTATCDFVRRSTYIATCNTDNFLIDRTGNRRFWVIPCKNKFDIKRLALCVEGKDDIFLKAYAQAYNSLKKNGLQSFRLTDREREEVENRNSNYMCVSDCENQLIAILKYGGVKEFTIDQLKSNYSELAQYDNSKIGRILTSRLDIPQRIKKDNSKGKSTTQRVYHNTMGLQ